MRLKPTLKLALDTLTCDALRARFYASCLDGDHLRHGIKLDTPSRWSDDAETLTRPVRRLGRGQLDASAGYRPHRRSGVGCGSCELGPTCLAHGQRPTPGRQRCRLAFFVEWPVPAVAGYAPFPARRWGTTSRRGIRFRALQSRTCDACGRAARGMLNDNQPWREKGEGYGVGSPASAPAVR